MMKIEALLRALREQRSGELHLGTGAVPLLPRGGALVPLPDFPAQTDEELLALLRELLPRSRRAELPHLLDLSWSATLGSARLRCQLSVHASGLSLVLRLPLPPPSIADLAAPAVLGRLCHTRGGLLVVAGPPGSGRSTTIAAIVDGINETQARHIVTIEDPVTYQHTAKRSVIVQREIGADVASTAEALYAVLRQDADVVVVDPLLYPLLQEAEGLVPAALLLAEAGVLVVISLQASRCVQAIEQVLLAFPAEQQGQARQRLSGVLRAVVAQRLCRKADGQGLVGAHAILLGGPQLPAALREGSGALSAYQAGGRRQGMQTLEDSLDQLLAGGLISEREARIQAGEGRRFGHSGDGV